MMQIEDLLSALEEAVEASKFQFGRRGVNQPSVCEEDLQGLQMRMEALTLRSTRMTMPTELGIRSSDEADVLTSWPNCLSPHSPYSGGDFKRNNYNSERRDRTFERGRK